MTRPGVAKRPVNRFLAPLSMGDYAAVHPGLEPAALGEIQTHQMFLPKSQPDPAMAQCGHLIEGAKPK